MRCPSCSSPGQRCWVAGPSPQGPLWEGCPGKESAQRRTSAVVLVPKLAVAAPPTPQPGGSPTPWNSPHGREPCPTKANTNGCPRPALREGEPHSVHPNFVTSLLGLCESGQRNLIDILPPPNTSRPRDSAKSPQAGVISILPLVREAG